MHKSENRGVNARQNRSDYGEERAPRFLSHGKTAKGAGLPMIFE